MSAYLGVGGVEHFHLLFEIHPLDFVDQVLLHPGFAQIGILVTIPASEGLEEAVETRTAGLAG